MLGSRLDQAIRQHIPLEDMKYYPYVFQKLISSIPVADIKDILAKNNRGKQLMDNLIRRIKSELENS